MPPAKRTSRLDHVDAAADDEVARLLRRAHHLAGREAKARCSAAQRAVALDVVGAQRLLEPVDAERLERPRALRRGGDVPARLAIAGHPPALVRVDHELELRADRVAHRLDDGDVLAPVGMVEADLHGADARSRSARQRATRSARLEQLAARGVGEQTLAAAAEQLPERHAERLAERGPRRRPPPSRAGRRGSRPSRTSSRTTSVRNGSRPTRSRSSSSRSGRASPLAPARHALVGVDADEGRLLVRRGTGSQAARNGGSKSGSGSAASRPP